MPPSAERWITEENSGVNSDITMRPTANTAVKAAMIDSSQLPLRKPPSTGISFIRGSA
ncbi:hypothetical protein GALL_439280 [mine drainage metagenome]|uniref:Uncharacterized protein n=1 Tax=mine drainage metagenome TaxID=410659 RepID=A0A1J5Q349_9ZZZZ